MDYFNMLNRLIILYMIMWTTNCQNINIGVIGPNWLNVLQNELTSRGQRENFNLIPLDDDMKTTYKIMQEVEANLREQNITFLFGEFNSPYGFVSNFLNLPYLVLRSGRYLSDPTKPSNIFSLAVPDIYFSSATSDILVHYGTTHVGIIITDDTEFYGSDRLDYESFLMPFYNQSQFYSKIWTINSKSPQLEENAMLILQEIRDFDISVIVIRADTPTIQSIMRVARYVSMISKPFKWIIPTAVCQDFGFHDVLNIRVNITFVSEICDNNIAKNNRSYDIHYTELAVTIMDHLKWERNADTLRQKLSSLRVNRNNGAIISFTKSGTRHNVNLTVSAVKEGRLISVGNWSDKPVYLNKRFIANPEGINLTLEKSYNLKHMRVVAVEEHPHLIQRIDPVTKKVTFEGFGVDLVKMLSKEMNITYDIYLTDHYGTFDERKKVWTGMINELLESRADMTLGPLVQSKEKEHVIDFTTSFKQREISLIMKRPVQEPSYFQFLWPFGVYVWVFVMVVVFVLGGILYLIERFSAMSRRTEIDFNLKECMWFVLSTTVQGATEKTPESIPARILCVTMYFFVLVIVATYTANLAAFLTIKASVNPINSIEDLANMEINKISPNQLKFGTVVNSGILEFFKNSDLEMYQRIYRAFDLNPTWLVNSSSDGYKRALKENYIFIWDDSVNQYEAYNEEEYECKLTIIGIPFGKRSFAIGVPQGASYREPLDKALLGLMEHGTVEELAYKWWKKKVLCPATPANSDSETQAINFKDIAGVFMVLGGGTVIALIALVIQIAVGVIRNNQEKLSRKSDHRNNTHNAIDIPTSKSKNNSSIALKNNHPEMSPEEFDSLAGSFSNGEDENDIL